MPVGEIQVARPVVQVEVVIAVAQVMSDSARLVRILNAERMVLDKSLQSVESPRGRGVPCRQELSPRTGAAAAQGLTTEAIAARQKISVDGVKKHFSSIFHKLGASSRSEAVAIGIRKHLLKA